MQSKSEEMQRKTTGEERNNFFFNLCVYSCVCVFPSSASKRRVKKVETEKETGCPSPCRFEEKKENTLNSLNDFGGGHSYPTRKPQRRTKRIVLMYARTLATSLTSTSGKFVSPSSSLRTRASHHLQNHRRRRFATSAMSKYTPGDALTNVTVVVTGSNRGIGLQLAKELLENDNVVVTTARDVGKAKELLDLQSKYGEDKVRVTELDVGSEASVKQWASNLAKDKIKVDVLINNAGIIGTEPGYKKWTWDLVDQNEMMEVFRVNSVGPLIVSQQLLKHNVLNRPALIANVTSKVGSVDDNGSGKGYAYRASKAALNIINKSMSIDLKEEFDCTCMLLHPGWVQTDMTEKRGLIETPECAKGLIKALEGKYGPLNGCWYDYKGDEIPW